MLVAGVQDEVLSFLADPATHGLQEPIKRIDTHGAIIFLAGKDVYKVKRAVAFDYMDFSTLEKRWAACAREIEVNRSYANELYIEYLPITRTRDGLHLGKGGEVVEWIVHLRRFDENRTLDKLSTSIGLEPCVLDRLAHVIAQAHEGAMKCHDEAAVRSFRAMLITTVKELSESRDIFPAHEVDILKRGLSEAFIASEALLVKRCGAGKIRRCHGDLHLRNIVMIKGEPVLFDAIEFDEQIATVDILFDIAFLLMDLWHRQMFSEANRLFNRYLWLVPDIVAELEGLSLLPMFLSLRAAIRAKVIAAQTRMQPHVPELRDEALAYLDIAISFLAVPPACLVAIGGLSGSGKTALSTRIAPDFGAPPGAIHIRSDIERKRLHRVSAERHLPVSAYTKDASERVYDQLAVLAETALRSQCSVIVDATFISSFQRETMVRVGERLKLEFHGFWLDAPLTVLMNRIRSRSGDASDADVEVLHRQAVANRGIMEWALLDANKDLGDLAGELLLTLG